MCALTSVFVCVFAIMAAASADSEITPFMVGGQTAVNGQFNYMASLQSFQSNGHFCGGAIISNHWVLTGAQCTINRAVGTFTVRVGSINSDHGGVVHEINKIRWHPNFNINTHQHDISVIRTTRPIQFNWLTNPIALATHSLAVNAQVTIPGWGVPSLLPGNVVAPHLQFLTANTIPNNECLGRHTGAGFLPHVFPTSVCTAPRNGVGICRGVNGGPVVLDGLLVSVVSFFRGCANQIPDVHTRVEYYIRWIQQNAI